MANLITCRSVTKSFGAQTLFENINLVVNGGDRIGIIGPNGSGKSTLLKIICGVEDPDAGQIVRQKFIYLSYLGQRDVFAEGRSIRDNLLAAVCPEDRAETELHHRVQTLLGRAGFLDGDAPVDNLSGGWRKRLSICRALLPSPDVLVMDEPTNHLDIEGILWLEKILANYTTSSAYLVVSHDRHFLANCTNQIVELSAVYPEGTFQVQGAYPRFLREREAFLGGQLAEEERLANKARKEIEWLHTGAKARTTKAKYRIDEAHKLRGDLAKIRARNRALEDVQIDFATTERKTKKLLEMIGVAKTYGDLTLFTNLDLVLSPGIRLGLLGRNGCGKSTLMKILAGTVDKLGVAPDSGCIKFADNIQIVSFAQNQEMINPGISLRRALAPKGDSIIYRGRSLHVVSWAKRFLFRPDQLDTPVAQLSGGERARILIANLMRQPADILLLDEPTNDLDIASLDVLETSLIDFPGALVLVSHDRFMLDRVCHRLLGFGGKNGLAYYADYEQWLNDLPQPERRGGSRDKMGIKPTKTVQLRDNKRRLSYMDQREYDQIEEIIVAAESKVSDLQARMELPEIVSDHAELVACWQELETVQMKVERLYNRWHELEGKKMG